MKQNHRLLFVLLGWLLLLSTNIQAQNQVTLSGRVLDESQTPLAFVTIKVDKQLAGGTTDLDGKYNFTFQTADTVVITYQMMGFQKRTKKLIRPQGKLTLNIVMKPMSLDLEGVTVKEVRRQLSGTQQLDVEKLKHLPSTTGNAVEELVATQAGVSTHNELSSQYNVRGGSFDENSVYINGVEVYRPLLISSGQQEGLSVINSDMVEKINFSAGGFDAQYGDKMSSVLDITYKKPTRNEAKVALSLLGGSVYAGMKKNKFSMTHGIRYKTNQYLLGSLETKGEYNPSFLDYQTYISWQPNKKWSLDVIGNISQNKYDFVPENRSTNFGTMQDVKSFKVYFDGQEKDLFRTFFGTFSLSRHLGQKSKLSLLGSAFMTQERETYDIQGQYWLSETNTSEQLGVGTYLEHARNQLNANMEAPIDNEPEYVFLHDLAADADGNTFAAVINEKLGLGIRLSFQKKNLPYFMQWKSLASGDYVNGLEPANSSVYGRKYHEEQNTVHTLAPQASETMEITITLLEGDELRETQKMAENLRGK